MKYYVDIYMQDGPLLFCTMSQLISSLSNSVTDPTRLVWGCAMAANWWLSSAGLETFRTLVSILFWGDNSQV